MAESPSSPPLPSFKLPPLSNPFFFQLMPTVGAGIGIGCGVGIGFGKQVAFGAIPGLDVVADGVAKMGHQMRGVHRVVKKGLAKSGLKGLDAGLGCGVGVGYGLGAGLFLKPGVTDGLVETGKEFTVYAKAQLHARYAHLLPAASDGAAEEASKEDNGAAEPSAVGPSLDSGSARASSGNKVDRGASSLKVSKVQGGTEAPEASVVGSAALRGSIGEGSAPELRNSSDADAQEKATKPEEGDQNAQWLGKPSHKSGTQMKKGTIAATDKELSRLQLENDLLRETLRQRELIGNLESEVHALRESLNVTVTGSGAKLTLDHCSSAPFGNLCFKCQQAVLGRRK